MSAPSKLAVFLHSKEYDRMHQGLSIAAAGVAIERPTDVFFFWGALERLSCGELDEPRPEELGGAWADRFETRAIPTLRQLLGHLKESDLCTLYACTGSMTIVGARTEQLDRWVSQYIGWTTILRLTQGIVDRFYL